MRFSGKGPEVLEQFTKAAYILALSILLRRGLLSCCLRGRSGGDRVVSCRRLGVGEGQRGEAAAEVEAEIGREHADEGVCPYSVLQAVVHRTQLDVDHFIERKSRSTPARSL